MINAVINAAINALTNAATKAAANSARLARGALALASLCAGTFACWPAWNGYFASDTGDEHRVEDLRILGIRVVPAEIQLPAPVLLPLAFVDPEHVDVDVEIPLRITPFIYDPRHPEEVEVSVGLCLRRFLDVPCTDVVVDLPSRRRQPDRRHPLGPLQDITFNITLKNADLARLAQQSNISGFDFGAQFVDVVVRAKVRGDEGRLLPEEVARVSIPIHLAPSLLAGGRMNRALGEQSEAFFRTNYLRDCSFNATCDPLRATCGNGRLEVGEQCDGNTIPHAGNRACDDDCDLEADPQSGGEVCVADVLTGPPHCVISRRVLLPPTIAGVVLDESLRLTGPSGRVDSVPLTMSRGARVSLSANVGLDPAERNLSIRILRDREVPGCPDDPARFVATECGATIEYFQRAYVGGGRLDVEVDEEALLDPSKRNSTDPVVIVDDGRDPEDDATVVLLVITDTLGGMDVAEIHVTAR